MFNLLSQISEYLKKCQHKLIKAIQDFSFIFISENDNFSNYFEQNQLINQNIQNSEVIIIDRIVDTKSENEFIIICFKKTLIILKQTMINSLYTLLSNYSELSVCFLKKTKEIFTEQIKNPLIEYDSNFDEEINSINKVLQSIGKIGIFRFWQFISPCISGYLIKESYFKINQDRIQDLIDFEYNHLSLGTVETNDYIELRTLGFGSLFVVQLIYHIERGKLFALKKTNSSDKNTRALIEREIKNYSKIKHPLIPKFYGTVKNDNYDYIIIEFINGQTLGDCKFDGYNENDIIDIICELLWIVDYIHSDDFLIRDLKPNNLMITEKKDIVMIDFDRVIDKSAQTHTGDLTNIFVAPEVDEHGYSEKSDIYSLGKVIEFIINKTNPKMKISVINDIIKQCTHSIADQRPSIKKIISNLSDKFQKKKLKLIDSYVTKLESFVSLHSSNKNYSQAQFILGVIYDRGEYVKRDINKAIYYFSLASNQNYPEAQFYLGLIYSRGKYVERDINKAIYYYSLASNKNYPHAQFILGDIYYTGKYVERDINKAIYYFSLASNQNIPEAQLYLGLIYYSGFDCKQDIYKGKQYIMLSSYYECRLANFAHGFLLHKENKIVEAVHYYKEASTFNIQYAKNNLGIIYKHGFGDEIQKRIGNSIEYFEEAIRQKNDILSMYNLARIHFYDETIKQDIDKSIELLFKSSTEFEHSFILLCVVLIKTFGFNIEQIKIEIEKRVDKTNDLYTKLSTMINTLIYSGELYVDYLYETYRNKDFLYDVLFRPVCLSDLLKEIEKEKEKEKNPNLKDISEDFYEGFGYDLINTNTNS